MPSRRGEKIESELRAALLELLREKPLDKITVNEVVDCAGISKSTLYVHYPNLYALAQDCYLHDQIYFGPDQKRRGDYTSREEAVQEVLQVTAERLLFFKRNPNLAKVILLGEGISPEFNAVLHAEEALTMDHLMFEYGAPKSSFVRFNEAAHFIQTGRMGMFRHWFFDGMRDDIEHVAKAAIYYSLCVTASTQGRAIEDEYRKVIEDWHFVPACDGSRPCAECALHAS